MRRYAVEKISEGAVTYFFICDRESMEIVLLPSKYLKHKIKANRSPQYGAAGRLCHMLLPGISPGNPNGDHAGL